MGKKNNNAEVKALTDFRRSDFKKRRDTEKINAAMAIYNTANGKDLAFAKVTPEDITRLNELADEFRVDIADLSSGISIRAAAGKSLDEMISDGLKILKDDLDKYMYQFSGEDSEFYNGYRSARVIWDQGGRRREEEPQEQPQG